MRIIHIMHNSKFTKGIVTFYNVFFCNGQHEILYLNREGRESLINLALTIKQREIFFSGNKQKNIHIFLKMIQKYDYIVLHSLFIKYYLQLALLFHPKIMRKIVWIESGADLYDDWKNRNGIVNKLYYQLKYTFRKKISHVVFIFPPDKDEYLKLFPKSKSKLFYAPYCGAKSSLNNYTPFSRLKQTNEENGTVWIQVGHSAVTTVKHIDVLHTLEKYKKENIKILLPLSYGDMQYAEKVKKTAIELFSEKAVILTDFMEKDEYFRLVSRVDIAIYNTSRQIALGNIYRQIFHNTKLFIPRNSVMYDYFTKNGVPIQDYLEIETLSFQDFTKGIDPPNTAVFRDFIDSLSNMDRKYTLWDNIYKAMEDKLIHE